MHVATERVVQARPQSAPNDAGNLDSLRQPDVLADDRAKASTVGSANLSSKCSTQAREGVSMQSRRRRTTRRSHRIAVSLTALAALTGCAVDVTTTRATTAISTPLSTGTAQPAASAGSTTSTGAGATAPGTTATSSKPASNTTTAVVQKLPGAAGPDDPCGIVTLSDVQAVLTGAPEGKATLPSGASGTVVVGSCSYTVDPQHRVVIMVETAPAPIIAAAKAGAANQTNMTKVARLGDVGYSTNHQGDSSAIFYVGNTQVQIIAVGQANVSVVVQLAMKVADAL